MIGSGTRPGPEEQAILDRLPNSPNLLRLLRDLEGFVMEEGFLHLSTDDLASRLRCSKGTLYRLANSREGLFELVTDLFCARQRDAGWRHFDAATDWGGRLVGYLHGAVEVMGGASYQFLADLRSFAPAQQIASAHQRQRVADLERIIQAGIRDGAYQDVHPNLAAQLVLTLMRHIIDPEFLAETGVSLAEAFGETYRIFEYGLIRDGTKQWSNGSESLAPAHAGGPSVPRTDRGRRRPRGT